MKSSVRAFTLIELTITIVILAVITVALASRFAQGNASARFNGQIREIEQIIQRARGYSLSSTLISDTEPADYYVLTLSSTSMVLEAYGPTLSEEVSRYDAARGLELKDYTAEHIYYFPPDGEICFEDSACTSSLTEISFLLTDDTNELKQPFTINKYGGYPETED